MIIKQINTLECQITRQSAEILKPCLSFTAVTWTQGRFKKTRREYQKSLLSRKDKTNCRFYIGHLDRVLTFCKNKGIKVEVEKEPLFIEWSNPEIPGITLRKDQKEVLKKVFVSHRGIVKEPTGTGKTILQLGIISATNHPVLLLANSKSIVTQTVEKIRNLLLAKVIQIGGDAHFDGNFFNGNTKIFVATIQSFKNIPKDYYKGIFYVVLVDEAHHISKFNGTYAKVLSNIDAPIRVGFTATLPYTKEAKFATTAFLGPIISTRSINEAVEAKILSKPKIKLIRSSYQHTIRQETRYADVYKVGIVENSSRNRQIVKAVKKHFKNGESTLIFVNKIGHGRLLREMFRQHDIRVPLIMGNTPTVKREAVKKLLIKKKKKVVIATTAWKEGIDIPSLDVVFNAGGEKSEIATLQTVGRGLRRTDEKDTVIIYDFFDSSHPYLIAHFGERITLYMDNNWL